LRTIASADWPSTKNYRQSGIVETLFTSPVSFFPAVLRHDNEHIHAPSELRAGGGTDMTVNIRIRHCQ
jgi:hypothetical protein